MGLQKYRADKAGEAQSTGAVPWFTHWMGGRTLALIRNCPIDKGVLPSRTVYVRGEPDTYFSIPAACSYRGKAVKGFLMIRDENWVFIPYTDELKKVCA